MTAIQKKKLHLGVALNLSDEDELSRSIIVGSVTTSSEQETLGDPFASSSLTPCADKIGRLTLVSTLAPLDFSIGKPQLSGREGGA
uniref:Uncharacterized protein n=1 Tax=Steinernema glaseri TaxID=37863 RepID=A0A1I8AF55_9BILA